ncbi:MAG: EAL domain-containing protein, partial [Blautia sp.]|nr:EAL domain-containing protein [Blautia sp.]
MKQYQFSDEKRETLEGMPQPFGVYQYSEKKVSALILSKGFCDLFGYTDHEKAYTDMNRKIYGFVHPDDAERITNVGLRFIAEGGIYDVVYRTKNRKASWYQVVHAIGKYVTMEDGSRLAYIWYMDEGRYAEEGENSRNTLTGSLNNALHEGSILKAIRYDYLTGLPSMTHFFELSAGIKQEIKNAGDEPVLLYFDLSGMKFFNTRYSFEEGDRLLQAFAGVLLRAFGVDHCCRAGADHFGAATIRNGLEDTLDRLLEECQQINGGNALPVHIGIYPNGVEDVPPSVAYDRAKLACDTLKKSYTSGYSFYSIRLRDEAEKRQYVLSHIDQAIREEWIQVYYQPIVRAVNGKVCDDEALARWIDPVKGFLSPADFIPYLEDAGVIYKLDLYMLEQILKKIRLQEAMGLYVVPQSLNLSREDFTACDIVEEIRKRVDDAGVSREMITIEITESTLGRDFDFMKEQVERFLQLGFPVWMDDFGSGYSSLDVLQSIKFSLIKFDMSFMQKLDEGDNGKIILTELMKMTTALGVDTVCEGVEREEQVRFLQEIGCSKLQGFYYAKPASLTELMENYQKETKLGYENPQESSYYDTIGRLNLFDLAVIASEETDGFRNFFHTLPMAVMEVQDGKVY